MSQKFLYGASCQGIQSFIFETDKLREIVGGSELVEQLCTSFFDIFLESNDITGSGKVEKITGAAGNIRYIFTDEPNVKKIVREFPMRVAKFAPGITISQAVITLTGDLSKDIIDELEHKLRIQRNRPQRPFDIGFLATQRCRRTARPAVKIGRNGMLDAALEKKRNACNEGTHILLKKLVPEELDSKITSIPFEMEEMVDSNKSGWLAVIHADGNNLGKIIQSMGKSLENDPSKSVKDAYRDFSKNLDKATIKAARNSFGKIILENNYFNQNGKFPIRPIVIGGDDLTVICRADLAINFTKEFLFEFQRQTKAKLGYMVFKYGLERFQEGLTACAGIAFVKPKYPFHYAAELAEALCAEAKKASKNESDNAPSSLAFYKVRSTFFDSFGETSMREAMAGDVSLEYGPYSIDDSTNMPSVADLLDKVQKLKNEDSPASSLRQWLSILSRDPEEASQNLLRIRQISPQYDEKLKLAKAITDNKTPVADWLSLLSLEKGE